jgi:hypothetical protein
MAASTRRKNGVGKTALDALPLITQQAIAFYRERLQASLEPSQNGKGIAIHVSSGDYSIDANPTLAGHAMRKLHPEGGIATFRIGFPPEPDLAGRLEYIPAVNQ